MRLRMGQVTVPWLGWASRSGAVEEGLTLLLRACPAWRGMIAWGNLRGARKSPLLL